MCAESLANKLTVGERRFVTEYLQCWKAGVAAQRAGYSQPEKKGWQILRRARVKAYLREMMDEAGMKGIETLARLTQQARLNAADFLLFEDQTVYDGQGIAIVDALTGVVKTERVFVGINWEMVERQGHLVKGMKYSRQGVPILEFYDAQVALKILAQANALLVDRQEISGPGGAPLQVVGIEVVQPDLLQGSEAEGTDAGTGGADAGGEAAV